jgi:hypothetical protein
MLFMLRILLVLSIVLLSVDLAVFVEVAEVEVCCYLNAEFAVFVEVADGEVC